MKHYIAKILRKLVTAGVKFIFGENSNIYKVIQNNKEDNLFFNSDLFHNSKQNKNTKLYAPYKIKNSEIGEYTYIAQNSIINNTKIGKCCSIGPNLTSGWGVHPTNGISTHPMFYSKMEQNGMTLSKENKIKEVQSISIGNDVFIGMNVTILDGVTIGDGAVIGAGSVVSKDIPSYAIAIGCPIKVKSYRFDEDTIEKMKNIKWWNFPIDKMKDVEVDFFNIESFISKNNSK